jgi:hypothetical protein
LRNLVVQDGEAASKKRSLAILNMTLDNFVIEEKKVIRLLTHSLRSSRMTTFLSSEISPILMSIGNT